MAQTPQNVLGPITIESLAHGGEGVGHFEGKTMFIGGAFPGDVVYAIIKHAKKRYAKGEVGRIVESSPQRVAARCPFVETCGGCPWQKYAYDAQVEAKRDILEQQLMRLGGCRSETLPPIAVVKSRPYEYRRSLRMLVRKGVIGYRRQRSHDLAAVDQCPIVQPQLWSRIAGLQGALTSLRDGELQATISDDGQRIALHVDVTGEGYNTHALADRLINADGITSVKVRSGRKTVTRGDAMLQLEPGLWVAPGGFVQANAGINRAMMDVVARWVQQIQPVHTLELYAGSGNFTRCIAPVAAARNGTVVAVEAVDSAIRAARAGAAAWEGGDRVRWIAADVGPGVLDVKPAVSAADVILLDPPRTGAAGAMPLIETLRPRAVISISCDPATHARDIRSMSELGYRIEELVLADQFPHTYHSESLALLRHQAD